MRPMLYLAAQRQFTLDDVFGWVQTGAEDFVTGQLEQLGNTRITAPFTGVVSEMPFSAGDVVQPGTALYTIIDPSSLELEASVPAERLEAPDVREAAGVSA